MAVEKRMALRRRLLPAVLIAAAAMLVMVPAATAQNVNDPYTGGGVSVGVQVSPTPGIFLSVGSAKPGDRIRISACALQKNSLVRITLNPGNRSNQGHPCPKRNGNALGVAGQTARIQPIGLAPVASQVVQFQTTTTPAPCPFDHPTDALAPDTTAGGAIAATNADDLGCADTWVTVPDRPAGDYEVCAVSTGVQPACAVLQIISASSAAGGGQGFARTGLELLPFVIAALLAIYIGRQLMRRSRAAQH